MRRTLIIVESHAMDQLSALAKIGKNLGTGFQKLYYYLTILSSFKGQTEDACQGHFHHCPTTTECDSLDSVGGTEEELTLSQLLSVSNKVVYSCIAGLIQSKPITGFNSYYCTTKRQ